MPDLATMAKQIEGDYVNLRRAARTFDDVQHMRMITANRLGHEPLEAMADVLAQLEMTEAAARKAIESLFRAVAPEGVQRWAKETPGISAYQLGRLLGEAGHPRLAIPYRQVDNPDFDPEQRQSATNEKRIALPQPAFLRTPSQWRQRCGHGSPGRHRTGETQAAALGFGLPRAKMIVHLMMGAPGGALFQNGKPNKNGGSRGSRSPYNVVIEETKLAYAERRHTVPCPGGYVSAGDKVVFAKCKIDADGNAVSGSKFDHYAEAGDPFAPSHIHAIGLRHAGKAMLADLWNAADDLEVSTSSA